MTLRKFCIRRFALIMIILTVLLMGMALIALCLGQYSLAIKDVFNILILGPKRAAEAATAKGAFSANAVKVVFNIRIPRIVLSILAGAGLSVAGAAFQAVFSNPLATPDTIGVANAASFGAALAILFGMPVIIMQLVSAGFGILAVLLVFFICSISAGKEKNSLSSDFSINVILSGIVISSLFSALVSFLKYIADPLDKLPSITFWLMGSFSSATAKKLIFCAPFIISGIIIITLLRYKLNILSLGDEEAVSLGLKIKKVRLIMIAAASIITAAVVSTCGLIGWCGLIIPHLARLLTGSDNKRVVPLSIVLGGMFMLLSDTLARGLTRAEIPVSIITAVIGAPVFIILLIKSRRAL
ncbi:MAG: iron ABC transporter permease [Lachnospiraceae bacterium]|nr:iron ABC transporter permease [Lachnospiraceae bacterium]